MTATIIIGVGGLTSATIGATMHTSFAATLHKPNAVATRLAGKSSIRHMQAATHPILTPNLVIMINTEAKKGSEPSVKFRRFNEPANAIRKAAANKGFVPSCTSTTPAPSLAIVSASAAVYELIKMSPSRYFISKLTSVFVKPRACQQSIMMSRLDKYGLLKSQRSLILASSAAASHSAAASPVPPVVRATRSDWVSINGSLLSS
mmetsp:Transcript_28478/g.35164  ORF Transcript_28478/g.35164 Transcript_28478/m.35164 type:complete len:205 (+) Transcript_28478:162-776(+)